MRTWKLRVRRHTYRSHIDGSREPYRIYVPRGYRRRKTCPLVVLLHGFGEDERGLVNEHVTELADERGYLLLSLRGRGSVFYDGLGEDDFFQAFTRTLRRYSVDEDRVYLIGVSMGGTGVWRLATRHPHLFAAAVPVCGWSDWRLWYPRWYSPENAPDEIPSWRRALLEAESPLGHAVRLRDLPVCILHGARDDIVDVRHARRMYRALRRLGVDVVYKEYGRSAHRAFQGRWRAVFDWFEGRPLRSWIGGRYTGPASAPGVKRRRSAAAAALDRPMTIGQAFESPFLLVAGAARSDRVEAERFASMWRRWMTPLDDDGRPKGRCRVIEADKLTPADVAHFDLVLFGRPDTNTVLARIAARLPIEIASHSVRSARTHRGRQVGVVMVCPNPLNQKCRVVVWSGHLPLRCKDLEALPWLLPAYAVFDERRDCRRTAHALWQLHDRQVADGEIDAAEMTNEDKPPLYLPDCFLEAGFLSDLRRDG